MGNYRIGATKTTVFFLKFESSVVRTGSTAIKTAARAAPVPLQGDINAAPQSIDRAIHHAVKR